jgi:hypothetical protein
MSSTKTLSYRIIDAAIGAFALVAAAAILAPVALVVIAPFAG